MKNQSKENNFSDKRFLHQKLPNKPNFLEKGSLLIQVSCGNDHIIYQILQFMVYGLSFVYVKKSLLKMSEMLEFFQPIWTSITI